DLRRDALAESLRNHNLATANHNANNFRLISESVSNSIDADIRAHRQNPANTGIPHPLENPIERARVEESRTRDRVNLHRSMYPEQTVAPVNPAGGGAGPGNP